MNLKTSGEKNIEKEDMKKLRTEKITTFLVERGYLLEGEERYRRPTTKGKLLGIFTDNIPLCICFGISIGMGIGSLIKK